MKKYFLFALMGIFALAASCAKQDDVDNLQKQIDELKSDQIATISSQVSSINTSITNLVAMDSELKGYITTLQGQARDWAKADEDLDKFCTCCSSFIKC